MITIKCNVDEFVAHLTDTSRTQVPFATSLTLNRCADESVAETVRGLPSKFIIRNNWISKGFRVSYARKDNLVTTISHKDPFMSLQEYGGNKTPLNANSVAVPLGARPTPSALTPQSKWPGKINRRFFIEKNGLVMEFARSGRKTRKRHKRKGALASNRSMAARGLDPNLKLMYVFKKSVPITPKLGLTDTIKQTFDSRFGINFSGFLEYAVSTRRP